MRALPPFMQEQKMTSRSWLGKQLLGDLPNLHEQLFWFDRKGPKFIESYIRLSLILLAIYVPLQGVLMINTFVPELKSGKESLTMFIIRGVITALPYLYSFRFLLKVAGKQVHVTNIEMMRKKHRIEEVKLDQKTKKIKKNMKILNTLRINAKIFRESQFVSTAGHKAENTAIDMTQMDMKWRQDIEAIFASFDVNDSGDLDEDEVFRFLKSLGQNPTKEMAHALCTALDKDGDGTVGKDEFVQWMYIQQKEADSTPTQTLDEVAKEMFELFDQDGSDSINRTEMQGVLSEFGILSKGEEGIQEMNTLMKELDPDGDGDITVEEFKDMLERNNFMDMQ
jgi:Ca2+-binding EF-hand superfamily protein